MLFTSSEQSKAQTTICIVVVVVAVAAVVLLAARCRTYRRLVANGTIAADRAAGIAARRAIVAVEAAKSPSKRAAESIGDRVEVGARRRRMRRHAASEDAIPKRAAPNRAKTAIRYTEVGRARKAVVEVNRRLG